MDCSKTFGSGHDSDAHYRRAVKPQVNKNRKICEQKSKNMACITQWTNKSIRRKTCKNNIVLSERASKEIQIHINIAYAAIKLRPKGSSKTMTVLSSP